MEGEVEAADQHEDDGDRIDGGTVEVCEACVMRADAREADGRHHVHDGVFPFHACQMVGDRAGDGDAEIDDVERLGRVGDAGRQAVLLEGARRLGLDDLRAAHAEQRENGHGQHDEAHAADPREEAAPAVQ